MYKQQADTIFRIIHEIQDQEEIDENEEKQLKTRLAFSWKDPGNDGFLENLDEESSVQDSNAAESNSENSDIRKEKKRMSQLL